MTWTCQKGGSGKCQNLRLEKGRADGPASCSANATVNIKFEVGQPPLITDVMPQPLTKNVILVKYSLVSLGNCSLQNYTTIFPFLCVEAIWQLSDRAEPVNIYTEYQQTSIFHIGIPRRIPRYNLRHLWPPQALKHSTVAAPTSLRTGAQNLGWRSHGGAVIMAQRFQIGWMSRSILEHTFFS